MGVMTRSLYEVRIRFYGLDEPDDVPLRASVESTEAPRIPDAGERSALALLIPLTASRLLHNSRMQRGITERMMIMLRDAAETVLAGEDSARAFDFRGLTQPQWDASKKLVDQGVYDLTEEEIALISGVPIVIAKGEPRSDHEFRCELVENRRGDYLWAKVHAPLRGPAFFAAFGLFALIERTANTASYAEVTVPAMAAVAELARFYFDVLSKSGWDDRQIAISLDRVVREVASAEDPLAHLAAANGSTPLQRGRPTVRRNGSPPQGATNPHDEYLEEEVAMSRENRLSAYLRKTKADAAEAGPRQDVAARVEMILSALELPWHVEDRANSIWGVEADVGLVKLGLDDAGKVLSLWQAIHPIEGDASENAEYFSSLLHVNATTTGACFAIDDYGDEDWLMIIGRIAAEKLDEEEVELALESLFYLSKLFDGDDED